MGIIYIRMIERLNGRGYEFDYILNMPVFSTIVGLKCGDTQT